MLDSANSRNPPVPDFRSPACSVRSSYIAETENTTKQPQAEIYTYPDAPHGFYCDERASYRKESGDLAWKRTQEFLTKHMKK